jgi:hypothetical protein
MIRAAAGLGNTLSASELFLHDPYSTSPEAAPKQRGYVVWALPADTKTMASTTEGRAVPHAPANDRSRCHTPVTIWLLWHACRRLVRPARLVAL